MKNNIEEFIYDPGAIVAATLALLFECFSLRPFLLGLPPHSFLRGLLWWGFIFALCRVGFYYDLYKKEKL